MRILFAATGEIAVPTLEALAGKGLIGMVLTSPDAPGKRGKALIPSPIKVAATRLGLDVSQPEHLGALARVDLSLARCDTLLSFCYGKIFGPKFLAMFPDLAFNIHPSLLPLYRGCSPLNAAILNQDRESGITLQRLALACDCGDIVKRVSFPLQGDETEDSLAEFVSAKAAELALSVFASSDPITSFPQSGDASVAPLIRKEEAVADFKAGARHLHAAIRAYYPWPKVVCHFRDTQLYLTSVSGSVFDIDPAPCVEEPGRVVAFDKAKGFKIATSAGYLLVNRLQLATKKELDAPAFYCGNKDLVGSILV